MDKYMVKIYNRVKEQKKELKKIEPLFSEVKNHFPLNEYFWVSRPSEGCCGVYDLRRFKKIMDFSFNVSGLPYFILKKEDYYEQVHSLVKKFTKKGLETTLELEYTNPKMILKYRK
jgi:hypothetical protein